MNLHNKSSVILFWSAAISGIFAVVAAVVTTLPPISKEPLPSSITQLESQVQQLIQENKNLRDSVKYSSNSADVKIIDVRVTRLETQENALSQTILEDPDKALTARYLRDKQQSLEATVNDIKTNQAKINERIDGIVTTLIAVPLVTFVLTFIGGVLLYIYNNHISKKAYK